jgi:hypothetical protein
MAELTDRQIKKLRQEKALRAFAPQLMSSREIPLPRDEDLVNLYEQVGEKIGRDSAIRYLEFGVFDGRSLIRMCKIFSNSASTFVGFDSFEGLPEDWAHLQQGTFSRRGIPPSIDDRRVRLVKGWFQNTLPGFLQEEPLQSGKAVTTLVHFDADLYSATLFVLSCLWLNIPEYFFIFDEFFDDEVEALRDFASAFPVKLEFFAHTAGYLQVFGKLTRTEFIAN